MRTCPRCGGRIGAGDLDPASGLARCPLCGTTVQASDLARAAGSVGRAGPPPGRIRARLEGLEGEVELLPAGLQAPQLGVLGLSLGLLLFAGAWTWSLSRGPAWAPLIAAPAWVLALSLAGALPGLVTERLRLRLGRGGLEILRGGVLGERAQALSYKDLQAVSPHPSAPTLERWPRSLGVALARAFSGGQHAEHHLVLVHEQGAMHLGEQLRPDELAWLLQLLREAARPR